MLASIIAAMVAAAAPVASGVQIWSPQTMTWQENRPGGSQRSVLEGDLAGSGLVTYAFRMPAGAWFPAHRHASTARVFVLQGVLLLGEGASSDPAKVRRVKAGEAVLVPANLVHYEGAEGETVIIGVAEGPWTTTFIDPTKP